MKLIKSSITVIIVALLSMSVCLAPKVMALNTTNEVELTDPVGGKQLPGGQILNAKDIKDSFVFSKLLPFVIKYAINLAIALAVIALIIGGYQYITAYGNEEQHKKAQKTIQFALIGLVLAITAFGIVQIITSLKFT